MPQLKRYHAYYYQVQGELAVLGLGWCDFVIFTACGLFVERIHFDEKHWEDIMLLGLCNFYKQHVPELLTRRLLKNR